MIDERKGDPSRVDMKPTGVAHSPEAHRGGGARVPPAAADLDSEACRSQASLVEASPACIALIPDVDAMPSNDSTSLLRTPALNDRVRTPDLCVQRYECLGLWVNLLEPGTIIDLYAAAIKARRRLLSGSVNLHTAYCHKVDSTVQHFFQAAELVCVDGMPIIWWLKCLGIKASTRHRATFADWLPALLTRARAEGWRVYYLGNRPGVTAKVAALFRERLPGLQIRTAHGHFDQTPSSPENLAVVENINAFDPDILLVGMGIPQQERWVLANATHLNARVIHRCGAAADFFAKINPLAPRWLGRLGLEGAFRLVTRPRHLWRRYLVEPWFLLDLAAKDVCRCRPRPPSST